MRKKIHLLSIIPAKVGKQEKTGVFVYRLFSSNVNELLPLQGLIF